MPRCFAAAVRKKRRGKRGLCHQELTETSLAQRIGRMVAGGERHSIRFA